MSELPPEIMLGVVSQLKPLDRINLATSCPALFLRPGFNLFVQCAEKQVAQWTSPDETLLPVAIKNNISIPVIRDIIRAYKSVRPESIDGDWGQTPPTFPPPIHLAVKSGRPEVVSLLLDEGADPERHFTRNKYLLAVRADCSLSHYNHSVCQDIYGVPIGVTSNCATAMSLCFYLSYPFPYAHVDNMLLEECALVLHEKGAPAVSGYRYFDDPLLQRLFFPFQARFHRLVKAILDPLVPLRQGQDDFRTLLGTALRTACNFRPMHEDDDRSTIAYLISIGAPIVAAFEEPNGEIPTFHNTLMHAATACSAMTTATILMNAASDQGLSYDYHRLDIWHLCRRPLLFVQALAENMRTNGGFIEGKEASTKELHKWLCGQLVKLGFILASQWMIDEGLVSRPEE
ncbi:hypothetical protein F4802DRAFT_616919 [Xylaria palmicola]|nr:hypothetical protein F4802DRAFT_616919 [Xylaria palmicola]